MTRETNSAIQKIEKEIQKLQKQAKALQAKQRTPVIASIIRSMREYDITPTDIAAAYTRNSGRKTAKKAAGSAPKRVVPPKYRHPDSGDTWTGRGKAPRWITEAETQGKSRDEFLINN